MHISCHMTEGRTMPSAPFFSLPETRNVTSTIQCLWLNLCFAHTQPESEKNHSQILQREEQNKLLITSSPSQIYVIIIRLTHTNLWESIAAMSVHKKYCKSCMLTIMTSSWHTIKLKPNAYALYLEVRSQNRPHLASYPGGGKSGLVSTVCVCDSGNLLQTSPIMDKLHVVVMWRKNQTRYTACSVAAVFYTWCSDGFHYQSRRGDTTRTTLQPPSVPLSLCLQLKQTAVSQQMDFPNSMGTHRNMSFTIVDVLIASSYSAFNVKSTFLIQQRPNLSALSESSLFTCRARDKLETDMLRSYTVKINVSSTMVYNTP